ncbi:hypothetical protein PHLCEN_2v4281 [Hermanssonia centrifuga]|uniref:Uncharacterized protein n=1 Tax=Hermanssonia centrifuga TaxID=98765 RepID=A0A2R6PVE8_9APHY|nr:hypothetical protein PHLCEN_2v4281 [Hermanssonia centrifuga]
MAPSERQQQHVTSLLGQQFTSPKKRKRPPARSAQEPVVPLGQATRLLQLQSRLRNLLTPTQPEADIPTQSETTGDSNDCVGPDIEGNDGSAGDLNAHDHISLPETDNITSLKPKRRNVPDEKARILYERWETLLASLERPFLHYLNKTTRVPTGASFSRDGGWVCKNPMGCTRTEHAVVMLFWDHFESHSISSCLCMGLPEILVSSGMFPTSPIEPGMAVSINFLELYHHLFQRSADAVTAIAAALRTFYSHRGWDVVDKAGRPIKDPFHKGLGHAIQWYDMLRMRIERGVDQAVDTARSFVKVHCDPGENHKRGSSAGSPRTIANVRDNTTRSSALDLEMQPVSIPSKSDDPDISLGPVGQSPNECAPILKARCAACFGGTAFGLPVTSAGDSPAFYKPSLILPKEFVDAVGVRIEQMRRKPAKPNYIPKVPDSAVDACEHGHEAANGNNVKTADGRFDDAGLMALICRHDIPLFLTNVDTPGEQQKYAIALIQHLFTLIPVEATVKALYDIGCVLDRSMNLRSRRLWIVDRQAAAVGDNARRNLGATIERHLRNSTRQSTIASADLNTCGFGESKLIEQWELQKEDQLSIRKHAPARLKKELDAVLVLQAEVDKLEDALKIARLHLQASDAPPTALSVISQLQVSQSIISERVETLYSSLNINHIFPDLEGLPGDFVHVLLAARDIKISVRKRAIANFMEWDKLDQAAGGRDVALGTKLHQETRKKISKRKPALITAIKKYNNYCERLHALCPPNTRIHIPEPLPLDLVALRNHPRLMEDVWIAPLAVNTPPPLWLENANIRTGILAYHKYARCKEERTRCRIEAENMCRWFAEELTAIEVALRLPDNEVYKTQLQQRRAQHIHLKSLWRTSLVSEACYDLHIMSAQRTGQQLLGSIPQDTVRHFLPIELCHEDTGNWDDSDNALDTLPEDFINSVDGILLTDYLDDEAADDPDPMESAKDAGSPDVPLAAIVCMLADLPV